MKAGENTMASSRHAAMLKNWSRHVMRVTSGNNGKGFSRFGTSAPSAAQAPDGLGAGPAYAFRPHCGASDSRERHVTGIQFFRSYSSSQGPLGGPSGSDPTSPTEAPSVVTDDMLNSLIALKDFGNIQGLPPLDVILEEDEERDRKALRRELEIKKQQELESKRVKTVDELGRAYATGRRKASTARVWIKEGEGQISINGKPHDLYFPDIDQRLQLLEPFWQTNQLGVFDVRATVKGGGVSGQSGALRHGISKALQLFDPTLRPALKSGGMLTRDSRVVERKKPGKAKARKSFQWVKR